MPLKEPSLSWKDNLKRIAGGVVGNIKEKIGTILKQPVSAEKPQTQHNTVGKTAFHFHKAVQATTKNDVLQVQNGTHKAQVPLEQDGSLSAKSQHDLSLKGFEAKVHSVVRDFPKHRVEIQHREKSKTPGSVFIRHDKKGINLIYAPSKFSDGMKPDTLIITINDQPDSPVLRLPITHNDTGECQVHIPANAVQGSVEEFLYKECFRMKKNYCAPKVFKLELVHTEKEEEEGVRIHTLATHRQYQPLQQRPVSFPVLGKTLGHSIDIDLKRPSPIRPVMKPAAPQENKQSRRMDLLLRWYHRHKQIFDADTQLNDWLKEQTSHIDTVDRYMDASESPAYLKQLLKRLRDTGYETSMSTQVWLLETLPHMSVSEVEAIFDLDAAMRLEKTDRLLPASSDQMLVDPDQITQLARGFKESKKFRLVDSSISTVGMLDGEISQIHRNYQHNVQNVNNVVRDYFYVTQYNANLKPGERKLDLGISRKNFEQLSRENEELTTNFPYLRVLDNSSEESLQGISDKYQELYQHREKLFRIAGNTQLDNNAFQYVQSAFQNALQPMNIPPEDATKPMQSLCIRLATLCMQEFQTVHAGISHFEGIAQRSIKDSMMNSCLDELYQYNPLMSIDDSDGISIAKSEAHLKMELSVWETNLKDLCRRMQKVQGFTDIFHGDLGVILHKGKSFIQNCGRVSTMSRLQILETIYSNFFVCQGDPLLLSMYLDLYMGVLLQEPTMTTFYMTRPVIRRSIALLPESWEKKKDLMDVYDLLECRLQAAQL